MSESIEINVYNKANNRFEGTIKRRAGNQRAFGNFGAIQYSVAGKKVWSVGGQNLYLEPDLIVKLIRKGELNRSQVTTLWSL